MPRRARPGNRERIEAALTPTLRAALAEACELLGIRRDGWQSTPLEPAFTTAAVILEGAVIWQLRDGLSRRDAIEAAAIRLGVPPLTVRNRIERWTRASIAKPLKTHNEGSVADVDLRCSPRNKAEEARFDDRDHAPLCVPQLQTTADGARDHKRRARVPRQAGR